MLTMFIVLLVYGGEKTGKKCVVLKILSLLLRERVLKYVAGTESGVAEIETYVCMD